MSPVMATTKRRSIRLWVVALVVLLLVSAFVLPPLIGINQFRNRIAESIGSGIGRPVRMSSVKMQLLPRPGFEIADFVVEEDPAFGAEPILRCSQVTAYLRLLPLWHGRLEIARIAFDEPSVNLVRNPQGRWNFSSLLSQAAQIPKAPTAERHPRGLARFPYIDAGDARVNFKFGDEKMPFSFFNADLAVWLENPGEWRIQFAAQPVRTDLNLDLANTGILRLEGTLRQAPTLDQMPAQLHAEWSNAPIGQLSRIFTGSDSGWRGELNAVADIDGTASHADLKLVAKGTGIHRFEFEPAEPLNVEATCQARYSRSGGPPGRAFDGITCLMPTGEGHLLLTGTIHGVPENLDPALSLEVNHTPVAMAFAGVRLLRAGFAPALQPVGNIDGSFIYTRLGNAPQPRVYGQATVDHLTLTAPGWQKPLTLPALHLATGGNTTQPRPRRHAGKNRIARPASAPEGEATLTLEPFSIAPSELSGPSFVGAVAADSPSAEMLHVSGSFSLTGFSVHVGGQSHIVQLAALGNEFGLLRSSSVAFGPQGTADLDLTVHGPWMAPVTDRPAPPVTLSGQIHLRNAQLTGDFLAQPLQISSAQALLNGDRVEWTVPLLAYGPLRADGTLSYPTFCTSSPECLRHFTLHFALLDAAAAEDAILGTTRHPELVQELLNRIGGGHPWPTLDGSVQIGSLTLDRLTLHDVSANLQVVKRSVQVESLTGRALDGILHLSGSMDATDGIPRYKIDAQLDRASVSGAASLFDEKWGPGSLNLTAKLQFSGFLLKDLVSSGAGSFTWDWAKGGLPLDGSPPVHPDPNLARFDNWSAEGSIANSTLTLAKSQITTGNQVIPLTGTINFARQLRLASSGQPRVLTIAGTLQHPEITSQPVIATTHAGP